MGGGRGLMREGGGLNEKEDGLQSAAALRAQGRGRGDEGWRGSYGGG